MRRFFRAVLLASLLVVSFCSSPLAQVPPTNRPRIGVALSGGGALGLAHIGVIRYFEEHHIPIDNVAGTSMGGLVGGFYATGMDSAALADVVERLDWNAFLNPNPRFTDQPVVDKQNWNRTHGDLTFRFGKRFSLPAGLNSGELLSLLLSRITLPYSDLDDFQELPTPFRCVATDLVTGDGVVLSHGSLAQAMRSTMSIPAVFTPVKRDGMVLVDGGLVQNIPVEVAKDMGSDIVIAVSFDTPAAKADQLNSIADVLRQTVSIMVLQNERRSLKKADLVISVDTEKFSGTDYPKSKDIIQAGYDAAKKRAADLTKFELSPEDWERYLQQRRHKTRPLQTRGVVVAVAAPTTGFQRKAQAELQRKLGDSAVTPKELEDVLTGMAAATAVPGATYGWQQTPAKGYKVDFPARQGHQLLVKPSFQYGLSPGEPGRGSLNLSTTTVFEDAYKSRILGSLKFGYDPSVRAEYYAPLAGSGFFVAPGLLVERLHVNSYLGSVRDTDIRNRSAASFYAGMGTWRFAQLRIGMQTGYDSYTTSRIVDGVRAVSGGFATPELRWIYDSQDSGALPTHGTRTEGSVGYTARNNSYPFLQNDFSTFYPQGHKITLFGVSQLGTSFGKKLDYFEQYTAGGIRSLDAFRYQEFHANTMVTAGSGAIFHGPSVTALSVPTALAVWYEAGRFDLGSSGWQTHQSTSTGIFFPTPLGAAGFTISFNEAGKARFRLMLGNF